MQSDRWGKSMTALRLTLPAVAAVATAVVIASVPATSSAPQLTAATVNYLHGTNTGWVPTDAQYRALIGRVLDGTGTPAAPPTSAGPVPYDAGFWPISNGLIFDLTWNASVAQGVQNLTRRNPEADVIFGLSQGAAVASAYKAQHPGGTGNTFVLVENPNRPSGGVLSLFAGLHIPVLDVSFNGATPDNGDPTIDIARQYDGWSDFPTYPLNILATANALLGMLYVHGQTQTELTAADLEAARDSGDSRYYQQHGATTYYLIRTPRLPLLMPLSGIVPDPVLNAIDPVVRRFVELGYDRSDYSRPTRAQLRPPRPAQQARHAAGIAPRKAPATTARQTGTAGSVAPKATGTPTRPAASAPNPIRKKTTAGSGRASAKSSRD